jgi:hypothetical protein
LTGNRGVFEILFLNQKFVSTMPKRQPTRVQMDMHPSDCACFSVGANVVFIFNGREETPFRGACQIDLYGEKSLSDSGAMLDWFET